MNDPYETEAWSRYEKQVKESLIPKLRGSALSMVLNPGEDPDVKAAVELGMTILLDKPLIVVVQPDQYLSPALERVADEVIRAELGSREVSELVSEAVERALAKREVQ